MKKSFILLAILVISLQSNASQAEDEEGHSITPSEKTDKSENPLGPLPELDPIRIQDPEYVAEMWWRHYGFESKEDAHRFLSGFKMKSEEQCRRQPATCGSLWIPPPPRIPNFIRPKSEIPDREVYLIEPSEDPVKSEEPLGRRPKLDPSRAQDPEYVAEMWWRHYRDYKSKDEAVQDLKRDKLRWEQVHRERPRETSPYWIPPTPGNPDHIGDYFIMPEKELLFNCTYVKGYSYPDICTDGKSNIIFNSQTDGQEVLNKIVIKQKWKLGKYNKMPKVKPKPEFNISETFDVDE